MDKSDLIFITSEPDHRKNGLYLAMVNDAAQLSDLNKFVYSTADVLSDVGGIIRPLDAVLQEMDQTFYLQQCKE